MSNVIVVGTGVSQLDYLYELKKREYRIIGADQDLDSVGQSVCDEFIESSTYDSVRTSQYLADVSRNMNVVGAIAPCTGPPYRTLNETKRLLGLPHLTEEVVDIVSDKYLMRRFLNEIGASDIRQPNHNHDTLVFPTIAKPRCYGMGSVDVEIRNDRSMHCIDVESSGLTIEEYKIGREVAIDALWDGYEIVFLSLGWTLFEGDPGRIVGSTVSKSGELEEFRPVIVESLETCFRTLGLGPEYLNIDLLIDQTGRPHILEFEFAPADGVYLLRQAYGLDLISTYIEHHLQLGQLELGEFRCPTAFISDASILTEVWSPLCTQEVGIALPGGGAGAEAVRIPRGVIGYCESVQEFENWIDGCGLRYSREL